MKAITFQDVETLGFEEVAEPTIEAPSDAVVRVERAGVCGSDLHVYHGREAGLDPGTVMGHEFVGEVVAVGREIDTLALGQRVVSPFTTSCGTCFFCRRGLTARCDQGELFGWRQAGCGLHGAQAEYVRVPLASSTLVPIPDGIDPEAALLAGDVLSTGFFAAESGRVGPGDVTVVLGCGPVGLMASLSARLLGAERVLAFDRVQERLDLAADFGAEPHELDSTPPSAIVAAVTEGRGADVILEAVGSPGALQLAVDLVRPGGIVSVVGVHTTPRFDLSPIAAYDKNLTLKIGRCSARYYLDRTLEILARDHPPVERIISHRLPLSDGSKAYRIFSSRSEGCTKALLIP